MQKNQCYFSYVFRNLFAGIFIAESSCCKREKNMNLTSLEESHYFLMKEVIIQHTFKTREFLYIHFSDLTAKCNN